MPVTVRKLLAEVDRLVDRGEFARAEQGMAAPLALIADHPAVLGRLALIHQRMGRHAEAVKEYEGALAGNPDNPEILAELATAQADSGDMVGAIATLRRRCDLQPFADSWFRLGVMSDRYGDHDTALAMAEQCLEGDSGNILAGFLRARSLLALGRVSETADQYRELIAGGKQVANAWFGLLDIKTVALESAELSALRAFASDPGLSDDERIKSGFALGQACERAGHYDEAFAAFERANALMRRGSAWSAANQQALVDGIAAAFRGTVDASVESSRGEEVIFIVGLPRSGTTLVEQILAAHSEVEGASELPDLAAIIAAESKRRGLEFPGWVRLASEQDWERMGRDYLDRTARWRASRPRFTDKALENWMFVGAIRRMLPGSHIIACQRDPVETSWSCYKQMFAPGLVRYSYDFSDLASYWRGYSDLCELWSKQTVGFRFQSHERILADPASEIAGILGFCGMPFEERCMNFHAAGRAIRTASSAQVRQPLKRSTAQAGAYGSRLDSLRELIAGVR